MKDRISAEEYQQRVVFLHRGKSEQPTTQEQRDIRRAELDIKVDYRLGTDFPVERREKLWRIAEHVEKYRVWRAIKFGVLSLVQGKTHEAAVADAMDAVFADYSAELSPSELNDFFDLGGARLALFEVKMLGKKK